MTGSEVSDRIGFRGSELEQLPNNRCRTRVIVAWSTGDEFVGAAQGDDTEAGRLKCAVDATARALEKSVSDRRRAALSESSHDPKVGLFSRQRFPGAWVRVRAARRATAT